MAFELTYGDGDCVRVDLPAEAVLDYSIPRGNALQDPVAAVEEAVQNPLNFPSLDQATVPGDKIVLALDHAVPLAECAVAGVVRSLLRGHARPEEIRVVVATEEDRRDDPTRLLPADIRQAITVTLHDPQDSRGLAYLAASRDGKPIYFNRWIDEADVVIPIGKLRLDASWGYVGVPGCLYPTFSDTATQDRFRRSEADWKKQQRIRREEAEEAAWLLGVQFTVQVAPGPGHSLMHVLAGELQTVADQGARLARAAWLHKPTQRANLVVAAIDGGPAEQTWENFTRALAVASRAVSDGGAIVLCTRIRPGKDQPELDAPIPPSDSERAWTQRVVSKLLTETRERAQVYLLSDLDGDVVEDLGLGHVSAPEEVTRLSRRFSSCILLGTAQHAQIETDDE